MFIHTLVPIAFVCVAALILAHDRALVLYKDPRQGLQSQYWMIGFTSLALWLLTQANT